MAVESDVQQKPQSASSLDPGRVAEMQRDGELALIDVRQPDEWEAGRIGGARHVVLEELPSRADSIARDRPVVFCCRSGNRSAMAADAFKLAGYDAHNMAGGMLAWQAAGLPLEPEGATVSERSSR
jgi:rhodanese-related sulfurtransferase